MNRTWLAGALTSITVWTFLTSCQKQQVSFSCSHRFAKEYSTSPGRGYGNGVIQVLKKLSSFQLSDVYQPARDQFNGRGSFGNGGAMRTAPFALTFPDRADVKRVSGRLSFQASVLLYLHIFSSKNCK